MFSLLVISLSCVGDLVLCFVIYISVVLALGWCCVFSSMLEFSWPCVGDLVLCFLYWCWVGHELVLYSVILVLS